MKNWRNCSFLNSDHDSDSKEFLILKPRLINFEGERHDNVSIGPISATSVVDT